MQINAEPLPRLVVAEWAISSAEQKLLGVLNDYERHQLTWMLQSVECGRPTCPTGEASAAGHG